MTDQLKTTNQEQFTAQVIGPEIPSINDFYGTDVCLRDICSKAIGLFDDFRIARGVEYIKTSTTDYFSQTVQVPIKIQSKTGQSGMAEITRYSLSIVLEQFGDKGPIDLFLCCAKSNITLNAENELPLDTNSLVEAKRQASTFFEGELDDRARDKFDRFFVAYEAFIEKIEGIDNFKPTETGVSAQ